MSRVTISNECKSCEGTGFLCDCFPYPIKCSDCNGYGRVVLKEYLNGINKIGGIENDERNKN